MKYLKRFENIIKWNVKEGDFAIFKYTEDDDFFNIKNTPELRDFINNTIGEIDKIYTDEQRWILVKYDNVPYKISHNFYQNHTMMLNKNNIYDVFDRETYLQSKKYNL